jgi:hypothetical protein
MKYGLNAVFSVANYDANIAERVIQANRPMRPSPLQRLAQFTSGNFCLTAGSWAQIWCAVSQWSQAVRAFAFGRNRRASDSPAL